MSDPVSDRAVAVRAEHAPSAPTVEDRLRAVIRAVVTPELLGDFAVAAALVGMAGNRPSGCVR